jgi:hypothetical protein
MTYRGKISTRCGIKKGWLGNYRVLSVGSIESDVTFGVDAPSIQEPLEKTGRIFYDYYKRRDEK